jgi:hypothetical protein
VAGFWGRRRNEAGKVKGSSAQVEYSSKVVGKSSKSGFRAGESQACWSLALVLGTGCWLLVLVLQLATGRQGLGVDVNVAGNDAAGSASGSEWI